MADRDKAERQERISCVANSLHWLLAVYIIEELMCVGMIGKDL